MILKILKRIYQQFKYRKFKHIADPLKNKIFDNLKVDNFISVQPMEISAKDFVQIQPMSAPSDIEFKITIHKPTEQQII